MTSASYKILPPRKHYENRGNIIRITTNEDDGVFRSVEVDFKFLVDLVDDNRHLDSLFHTFTCERCGHEELMEDHHFVRSHHICTRCYDEFVERAKDELAKSIEGKQ